MINRQLAIISDIHGNRRALEAVLDDIDHRGIDRIVNLGDCLYGPLDPAGTADILIKRDIPTARGNEDRIIVEPSKESEHSPSLDFVREQLSPEHIKWVKTLEMTAVVYGEFLLCHGTPEQDTEYLLREVLETGVVSRTSEELTAKLASCEQSVILCGHDHVPCTVSLPDGRLIANPGSVGLPAYSDDLPFPHVMETFSPHARYSIVFKGAGGWRIESIAVPYDWEWAVEMAGRNGRPDWIPWLRTGRARVTHDRRSSLEANKGAGRNPPL